MRMYSKSNSECASVNTNSDVVFQAYNYEALVRRATLKSFSLSERIAFGQNHWYQKLNCIFNHGCFVQITIIHIYGKGVVYISCVDLAKRAIP